MSIKNKIADHISECHTLSDVCKLIRQVRREMENREAFTGISAEPEEGIDEVNWRQKNYNQASRGKGSVEVINKVVIIFIAMFQEEEVMIFREVTQQRK